MNNIDISIIICTHNRSHNLQECLTYVEKQSIINTYKLEIVLIDNNSTDGTKKVVEELIRHSPLNIRYVFEENLGIAHARNRGLNEAFGEYLVYIDDDIRVSSIWLESIISTFKEFDCDAVGGRIHIDSPEALPKWITPDMYGFLGYQDYGSEIRQLNGINESPFEGNMAIHRRVINLTGYFDIRKGRKGLGFKKEELFKGEGPDYFSRLANAGGKIYYNPQALVIHKILPHQLTKKFFLTLHNNAGIQKARLDNSTYPRTFSGIPLFLFPQLLRSIINYISTSAKKGPINSFRQLMTVFYFTGLVNGYFNKK